MTLISPYHFQLGGLLIDSYQRVVGRTLAPENGPDAVRWLYNDAPFGLLAQDASADPRFTYANVTAQKCFEYSWDEFVGLPSRLSADAPNRRQRQELMNTVLEQGYADGYRGLRITKSGRHFWIEDTTVWNIVDSGQAFLGQAAVIRRCIDS